jgi:hypothetical protein
MHGMAEIRRMSMPSDLHRDDIERRAYELFEQRGKVEGHDWDDWLQAEREIQGAETKNEQQKPQSQHLRRQRVNQELEARG